MDVRRCCTWLLSAALVVFCGHACGDETESDPFTPAPAGGPGGFPVGGGSGQGGGTGGNVNPSGSGGLGPVHLGVTANPLTNDGAEPSPSDVLNAELTTYAAGVGAISLDVHFDELDDAALTTIEQRVTAYRERQLDVILTLLVVDGLVAHRPASTKGHAWDHPTTVAAFESFVERLLDRTEQKLSVVLLSRRADVYAAEHPNEAAALASLYATAIQYVEARAPELITGVGVDFALMPRSESTALVALGDAVVLSYFPGLGDDTVPANTSPALDLDAMLAMATIPDSELRRPVVLQAVGYASSTAIASSTEGQLQRLDAFFAAVQSRRAGFPYVNVHQLHDLDAVSCDALLATQGLPPGDPWGDFMCTTGLRRADGAAKVSWQRFLEAAATFDD